MKRWSMQCPVCSQRLEADREEPWGFPPVPDHNSGQVVCSGSDQPGIAYRPAKTQMNT